MTFAHQMHSLPGHEELLNSAPDKQSTGRHGIAVPSLEGLKAVLVAANLGSGSGR